MRNPCMPGTELSDAGDPTASSRPGNRDHLLFFITYILDETCWNLAIMFTNENFKYTRNLEINDVSWKNFVTWIEKWLSIGQYFYRVFRKCRNVWFCLCWEYSSKAKRNFIDLFMPPCFAQCPLMNQLKLPEFAERFSHPVRLVHLSCQ